MKLAEARGTWCGGGGGLRASFRPHILSGIIQYSTECTSFLAWPRALKVHKNENFFWLRFWILYHFIVSYVKILRFCKKTFLIGPVLEEVRFFCVVLGLRGMKKNFVLFMNPFYELILVFSKFDPLMAPGMALCVNLGPKCQNLFCLVWD
jgi:hypothetical protein